MIPRFRLCGLLAFLLFPGMLAAQSDDLLTRIWDGVQQAQKKYTSGCGTITETRTSSLMVRPMVLHGKFCAEGTTRFSLEYFEPHPLRIRFNENYLNVTIGSHTQVMDVGSNVRRAQSYFSRENSIANLKKNFTITVQEDSGSYDMKLVPRSEAFRRRLNYLVVKLDTTGLPAAVARSGRQERCEQCVRHRCQFREPEDSGGYVRGVQTQVIERSEIETMIPHRPPFLWIDRVEELEPGVRCVAVKFVDPARPDFRRAFSRQAHSAGRSADRSRGPDRGRDAGIGRAARPWQQWRTIGPAGGRKPLQVSQARNSGPGTAH